MKILLVDDESDFLEIGHIYLKKNNPNFNVTGCVSAIDALRILEENEIDVIVSDFEMPTMNGLDFLKKVKERNSNLPFIIFTGRGREEVAIEALNLGVNRYIQKGGDVKTQYGVLSKAIINEYNHSLTFKKLTSSEEQYRTLVETMHDGIISVDTTGEIIFVNDKFCKMINYSSEELIDTNITNYLTEDNQRIIREQLKLRKMGTIIPYEVEWTKKNGDKISTLNSPNRLLNMKGKYIGSFAVVKDIAELKRVKTALSEREKELIYRSELDALLANISTRTINLDIDRIDQEISLILKQVCEFFKFDNGAINKFQDDIRHLEQSPIEVIHEYVRDHDSKRDVVYEQHSSILHEKKFPWLVSKIRAIEPFQVANIDDLPAEAKNWKKLFKAFKSKSSHIFPLVIKDKLLGLLAFQTTRPLELKEYQMKKIKIVSDIIQSIMESSIDKKELIYQSELDALLADISTKAINLDTDNTDQEITLILEQVCDFFKFDNAVILKYQKDLRFAKESSFTKAHEHTRNHDSNRDLNYKKMNFTLQESSYPWFYHKIQTLTPFQIADVDNLPPEADNIKKLTKELGSKSSHSFPLVIQGKLTGLLAFQTTKPLELKGFQMNKIKIVSDIIQSLLERSLDKKELIYQSELDALLADISTKAINLDTDNTDQEITLILEQVCEFFKFDSGVIFKYKDDLREVKESSYLKTHEFIRSHDSNRDLMLEMHYYKIQERLFPWFYGKLQAIKPFQIADIDNLPPEADNYKQTLEIYGAKSSHLFPLIIKGKLSGTLSFQTTKPLELKGFQMNKIKIVSDIIQSLLERSLDKQELIYQSELDTLLAHISTKAINLDTDNTDQEITLILKQMCEFFKFGGSEIIKFQDDLRYVQETKLTIIHEYKEHNPDSNQSFKQVSYGFKASLFPWLIRKIRTLKPFQVSNIDNLPPEADHWKNSLIASKSKSIHYFPLIIKERMLGILAFQSEKPLELKEFQMRNIKIVSDIIQSIIERSIDIDGMVK